MNDYQFEKAVRMLESIAKSMTRIDRQLEDLNKSIKRLSKCVEPHPDDRSKFNICQY